MLTSPAYTTFKIVDNTYTKTSRKKCELFHSTVAKLLYIMKRVRDDLEPVVRYHCTQVTKNDEDDWKKLRRFIAWVKSTIDNKRLIGATDLSKNFTYIDAAYAVHDDMMSH